jgi:cysteinyl-tRNA synthetase
VGRLETPDADKESRAGFEDGAALLKELGQVLGLFYEEPKAPGANDQVLNGLMQLLIDLRAEARKSKNFAMADQIRKRLGELSITLEDRAGGTGWRIG